MELKNIELNTYPFNITILSQKAPSEHIVAKLYVVSEEHDQYYLLNGTNDFFGKDGSLGTDETFSFNINFNIPTSPKAFYFLLIANYKDIDGKRMYTGRIYSYNMDQKTLGAPLEPNYSRIKDFSLIASIFDIVVSIPII